LENTEENSEKIGKIWKKIVKLFGKYGRKISYSEMVWKIWNKSKLNSEMILKIWKKFVK
jgi:hypothetical protein